MSRSWSGHNIDFQLFINSEKLLFFKNQIMFCKMMKYSYLKHFKKSKRVIAAIPKNPKFQLQVQH